MLNRDVVIDPDQFGQAFCGTPEATVKWLLDHPERQKVGYAAVRVGATGTIMRIDEYLERAKTMGSVENQCSQTSQHDLVKSVVKEAMAAGLIATSTETETWSEEFTHKILGILGLEKD